MRAARTSPSATTTRISSTAEFTVGMLSRHDPVKGIDLAIVAVARLGEGARLVVVGDGARHIHAAAGLEGSWDGESVLVPDVDAAYDVLRDEIRPGDIVLVKSSKSAGLRHLGDRIAGTSLDRDRFARDRGGVQVRAALDDDAAERAMEFVRTVVVRRGGEARAPRELLELTLPPELLAQVREQEQSAGESDPAVGPLERGPEITETR